MNDNLLLDQIKYAISECMPNAILLISYHFIVLK